jgi:ribonuclease P protein component
LIGRVRERAAFVRLRREGVRVRIEPLWCSFVDDPLMTPPRVAFAIGRAVGTAVARNRLRRRLRAILGGIDVPPGIYLIGAAPAAAELTFDELRTVTVRLIARATSRSPAR